jgi:zinc transport system permease protein
VVAVAIKVVGVLLIAAMLLIPAATARSFSNTPESMAIIAAVIAAFCGLAGVQSSYAFDTPTGPTIVCVGTVLFILTNLVFRVFR